MVSSLPLAGSFLLGCPSAWSMCTVEACRISFPDQGWNPGPLLWEHGVLATGPPGEVPCVLFSLKPSLIPTVPLSPSAPPQSQRPFSRDTLWKSVSFSSLRGESEMQRGVWHGFCPTALSYPSVPPLKFPGVPSPSHPCQKQGVPLGLEHHSAVPMPALFKGHVSS